MYKDFKKTESLDTGFVGGSGIVWMFSGIIIGLLVGLGMYYFSNRNTANTLSDETLQASEQRTIKQKQFNQPPLNDAKAMTRNDAAAANGVNGINGAQEPAKNLSLVDNANKEQATDPKKNNSNFSYYAVLPNLNVPVGSVKAVDTRDLARDSANIKQASLSSKSKTNSSKAKGKNKASASARAQTKNAKGKYSLQIASFKRRSSANIALRQLAKRGVKASIQKKKIKGRLWYRISAGSLDKAKAYSWKKKAEKLGHKPRVFQIKN